MSYYISSEFVYRLVLLILSFRAAHVIYQHRHTSVHCFLCWQILSNVLLVSNHQTNISGSVWVPFSLLTAITLPEAFTTKTNKSKTLQETCLQEVQMQK